MRAARAPAILAIYYSLFHHYSSLRLLSFLSSRQSITYRTAPQVRATVFTGVCICTCILSMYVCARKRFLMYHAARVQDRRLTLPGPINHAHESGGQDRSSNEAVYHQQASIPNAGRHRCSTQNIVHT
jgi:hypothetical protein